MGHCFRALLALAILFCSTHVWATASEEVIYTFTGGSDGGNPYAGPIMDANGNLYGTAVYGGEYGYGVVFELSPGSNGQWTETVLHSFNLNGKDGIRPYSSLVMDAAGNLYGTTYIGGTHGEGTVFEVSPHASGRWTERILHNFNANGKDGYNPYSNLIIDSHGNLFGTTYSGGTDGNGTVFELTPGAKNTWQETIVHDFVYTDGAEPMGGVVPDKSSR